MEGFGERIIKARQKKGLSQKALAELLNISATRLNYWEKNKREPDLSMFSRIVTVLESDANELLGLYKYSNNSIEIPKYNKLNSTGRSKADSYIDDLCEQDKYTINTNTNDYGEIAAWGSDGTEGTFETPEEDIT